MIEWFQEKPGRLYAVATLLPLAAAMILTARGLARNLARRHRDENRLARSIYRSLGGEQPSRSGAYLAIGCMLAATLLAFFGLFRFVQETDHDPRSRSPESQQRLMDMRWSESITWAGFGVHRQPDFPQGTPLPALSLEFGYRIDHLAALMFAMVTLIGTCIFVFSLGYMREETHTNVTDHETHVTRRGRFGRFYLYLSLFAFSMLNLIVADNLFQVFVSWELVGVCSFLLIGFYTERPKAGLAANKAFVMNRIGDAGFLVGLAILWTWAGTLNFQQLDHRLRSPAKDSHGELEYAGQFVRVKAGTDPDEKGNPNYLLPRVSEPDGDHVALFPLPDENKHFHGLGYGYHREREFVAPAGGALNEYGAMPYWLLVVAGLGVFLGCVGKSAQVPLHTWLADAMEGPTPVSALIHAATMVAAGVYLVGRCYFLFAPEVLLVIAYVGAVTLFLGATIALVATDIKRVLAYSTVSQLGFMMLALGVGAWVAGLLHLLTHAFFKALLFLGAGSVIHGCHHEQDMRKMGGLGRKMPVTAATMLIGVLAIVGTPLFSGWYSKDMILSGSLGYVIDGGANRALFVLPLVTAGLTGFYMFRLWLMTFAGKPRDRKVYEAARESPRVMTVPLIILAAGSMAVAWGWPVWDVEASHLAGMLHESEPLASVVQGETIHAAAEANHLWAGLAALAAAALGVALALAMYSFRVVDPARLRKRFGPLGRFLEHRWYIDELYDRAAVRPTVGLALGSAALDKPPPEERDRAVPRTVDGLLSAPAVLTYRLGLLARRMQTGHVRTYVAVLALTAVLMLAILSFLT